ncbi:hypothetical protein G9A89_016493 [Geosiphon pyriformis]|nr:hypothetical protein G9A89_016493 [Geosiphon pyriformis]
MLRTCDKKPIIRVTTPFAKVIRTEGSGYSRSGKLINISGCKCGNRFSCFEVVSPEKYPYGISSSANALNPFTSTAVNDIKAGTKIYVPQIDGLEIPPNGKEHNGCLIVGDEGYGFKGYHLDFFVYLEKYYGELDKQKSITKIDVFEGKNCDLLDYTFGLPKPKKFLKG